MTEAAPLHRVIVTGGSKGIGAAVTRRLAADGYQVIDYSRSAGLDVTDDVRLRAALIADMSSRTDGVVCCAGDVDPKPLAEETIEGWRHSFAVNLDHAWHVLNHVANAKLGAKFVILIASTAGTRPSPNWTSYAAAKAALINLGMSAHEELKSKGIRVYIIAPGRCATDLRKKLAPDEDPTTIMQPDEVAAVVARCAADTRGVLAGHVITVRR